MNYKEIHLWEFPPSLTFIQLNNEFKKRLFVQLIKKAGTPQKLVSIVNQSPLNNQNRTYSLGNLYSWIKGEKFDRGKLKTVNIPLWVLMEFSRIVSESNNNDNAVMRKIEKNIKHYATWGKSNPILNPKLPLYITPELVSIIFHFLGDGHIGKKGTCSSYRQMNKIGLDNFRLKLNNIFGEFKYSKKEYNQGRLNIPKIITHFYNFYFSLPNTDTFTSYVPQSIKGLRKEFLKAGLVSFIVDEGHVGEVITIYSKNRTLLTDIREIAINCGYKCHPIREKYAYNHFDVYRFSISRKSFNRIYLDILDLKKRFFYCDLAHKNRRLLEKIRNSFLIVDHI